VLLEKGTFTKKQDMETNSNPLNQEDKTAAIAAYITLIGFIIAIILHGNNKTKLGAYHLRQALGLIVTSVAVWIVVVFLAVIPFIGIIFIVLAPLVWVGILVLVIMGIINAANGQEKPLPLVGHLFEKWFVSAFA